MNFAIFVSIFWNKPESRQILYYEHTRISRKRDLASYGVRQRGIVANNAVEAVAAKQLTTETGTSWFVIVANKLMQVDVEKGGGENLPKLTQVRRGSRSNYWMQLSYTSNSAEGKKKCTKF
jgi:succinyl-CoA synthetase beta subunit